MNFAALQFWQTLGFGLLIAWVLTFVVGKIAPSWREASHKLAFSLISLSLLFTESPLTMFAFLWVVLLGWICVKFFHENFQTLWHKLAWIALIVLQLLPLFYFKYWTFVLNDICGLDVAQPHALIPMGLSFYSFQVISVCLDSKREGLGAPRFIDYFNYASFFPQIVAGPIERRHDLLPQIRNLSLSLKKENIEKAIPWIVLGLFYKMALADNFASIADASLINANNGFHVLAEILTFSLRIYFDFAGYSFVALGLGRLFGVQLTLNFSSPYWVTNLQEFWRKWHITLSQWLRDYVYFGLGGSRRGVMWVNLLLTFIISGVWHGAGWNYILWGALHGLGLIVCHYVNFKRVPKALAWAGTILFIGYSWLLFYETDVQAIFTKTITLLDIRSYSDLSMNSVFGFIGNRAMLAYFVAVVAMGLAALILEGISLRKGGPYAILTSLPACAVMAFLLVLLPPVTPSTFIYFNF